jgi:signal transduction histidine kinase
MRVDSDAEILRLRAVLRDLVAVSAIPAVWTGRDPPGVAAGLADELAELLQLDFAFVRLCDPDGAEAVEVARGDAWRRFPEWLESRGATSAQLPRKEILRDVRGGAEPCRGIAIRLGVDGEAGVVAAASERSDFPTATDQLLLSLAANQAATAFQNARLIQERRRAEEELREARNELETRVADRTAELRRNEADLAQLAEEQAALRRVATLVAEGASPAVVFDAVAAEMEGVLDADGVTVSRYEPGTEVTVVAHRGVDASKVPPGTRWNHEGENVTSVVRRTGRPARMEGYAGTHGDIARLAEKLGVHAAVGAPIVVEGSLWGCIIANWRGDESSPAGTEERMTQFAQLLDTTIAKVHARSEVEQLAEQQGALRRVATMVARERPAEEVFAKVAEEVALLLGVEVATVRHFEPDGWGTIVGRSGELGDAYRVGSRIKQEGESVTSLVYRTGRSARFDDYRAARSIPAAARKLGLRAAVASPIVVNGRLWGAIAAGTSRAEPMPADAESRIAQFIELVATAISNVQARSDLAASRARLVTEADEARRRVVRDLHDGAQQRLVHTIVTLGLAQRAVRDGDGEAESLIDEALEHAQRSNAELRELAHGILPAVLTHGGLRAGIDAVVARLDLPVRVDVPAERFPAEIEASAYFIVAEALTNVVKHARAGRAEVRVSVEDGMLCVEVRDDGVGGADHGGHGLVGMGDRVTALGGRLTIDSPASGGTLVAATLPVPGG